MWFVFGVQSRAIETSAGARAVLLATAVVAAAESEGVLVVAPEPPQAGINAATTAKTPRKRTLGHLVERKII